MNDTQEKKKNQRTVIYEQICICVWHLMKGMALANNNNNIVVIDL